MKLVIECNTLKDATNANTVYINKQSQAPQNKQQKYCLLHSHIILTLLSFVEDIVHFNVKNLSELFWLFVVKKKLS